MRNRIRYAKGCGLQSTLINSLGVFIFSLSTVLGYPVQITIAGRTPYLFWVEIVGLMLFYFFVLKSFLSPTWLYRQVVLKEDLYLFSYVFVLFLGLSITPPIDYLKTLAVLKLILVGIGAYVLGRILINSENQVHLFSRIISLTSLLFIVQFIYSFIQEFGWQFNTYSAIHYYIRLSWGRSNYLAAFFALFFALNIGAFFAEKKISWKIFAAILSFFSLIFAIMISSRGAFLSIIAGIAFFLFFFPSKKFIKLTFSILLFVFLLLFIRTSNQYLLNRLSFESFKQSMFSINLNPNSPNRIVLWKDAWNIFLHHPLIGVGIGNKGFFTMKNLGFYYLSSHNLILQTLDEVGIIGTFFLFLFYGRIFFKGLYLIRNNLLTQQTRFIFAGICMGLLIGFFHSLVEPNFFGEPYRSLFWLLLGFVSASHRILHNIKGRY